MPAAGPESAPVIPQEKIDLDSLAPDDSEYHRPWAEQEPGELQRQTERFRSLIEALRTDPQTPVQDIEGNSVVTLWTDFDTRNGREDPLYVSALDNPDPKVLEKDMGLGPVDAEVAVMG